MALFNYATRELSAKIVYYGPGLSGKTTNIEMIHKLLRPEQKGRLISLPTETDRTLFFDFLPVDLGQIRGFRVRFHLYTVPGQVFYNATRRLVLQGVDGVVFVADSQRDMAAGNAESLRNLRENLATYGKKLSDIPFVLQYNKRDLRDIMSVEEMNAALNPGGVPFFTASAIRGEGVTETLVAISRMVFAHLRRTLLEPGAAEEERPVEPVPGAGAEPLEELPGEVLEEETAEGAGAAGESGGTVAAGPGDEVFPAEAGPALAESAQIPGGAEEAPVVVEEGGELVPEEIEIDVPEDAVVPPVTSVPASVSVEAEGGGLTFLRFDAASVSPEGHAVLPAVFLDGEGNVIRIRIRIAVEEDGGRDV